jgi:GntR family transcriptional regulator
MVSGLDSATVVGLAKKIQRDAHVPLHDQISSLLRERITLGHWPAHMRLPSEPELARLLGVARGTVRTAIRTLTDEGFLVQHQGRGTFVGGRMLEQSFAQEMLSTSESLDRAGVHYETRVIRRAVEPANSSIVARLQMSDADAQVVALRRVRLVAGTPVFVLDNYVVASLCPGLESADFMCRSLFSVLEEDHGLRVGSMQRTFQAVAATDDVARLLETNAGEPVLYLEQTSFEQSDSSPIEYSDVWIRGDQLRLTSWLRR